MKRKTDREISQELQIKTVSFDISRTANKNGIVWIIGGDVYNLPGGSKVLVSDEQKVKAGDKLAETLMISEHGGEVRYADALEIEVIKSGKNKINKIVHGKEITIVIASLMPSNAAFEQTKKEQLWTFD